MSDEELRRAALAYHAEPRPGKIGTEVYKPSESSRDLSLAYSPGVAEPVRAIAGKIIRDHSSDFTRWSPKSWIVTKSFWLEPSRCRMKMLWLEGSQLQMNYTISCCS